MKTEAVTFEEGGEWVWFDGCYGDRSKKGKIHAIRFNDGTEWDCINGFRPEGTRMYNQNVRRDTGINKGDWVSYTDNEGKYCVGEVVAFEGPTDHVVTTAGSTLGNHVLEVRKQ